MKPQYEMLLACRWLFVVLIFGVMSGAFWKGTTKKFLPGSRARKWIGVFCLLLPFVAAGGGGYHDHLLLHRPTEPQPPYTQAVEWEQRTVYVTPAEAVVSKLLLGTGVTLGILWFPVFFLVSFGPIRLDRPLSSGRTSAMAVPPSGADPAWTFRRRTQLRTWGILLFITCFPCVFGGAAALELLLGTHEMDMSPEGLLCMAGVSAVILVALWGGVAFFLRRTLREAVIQDDGLWLRYSLHRQPVFLPRNTFQSLVEDRSDSPPTWILHTDLGEVSFSIHVERVIPLLERLAAMVPQVQLGWDPGRPAGGFTFTGSAETFRSRFPFIILFMLPFWAATVGVWGAGLFQLLSGKWDDPEFWLGLVFAIGLTTAITGFTMSLWSYVLKWRRQRIEVSASGVTETDEYGRSTQHCWSDILFVEKTKSALQGYTTYAVLSRQGSFFFDVYSLRRHQELVEILERAARAIRG